MMVTKAILIVINNQASHGQWFLLRCILVLVTHYISLPEDCEFSIVC